MKNGQSNVGKINRFSEGNTFREVWGGSAGQGGEDVWVRGVGGSSCCTMFTLTHMAYRKLFMTLMYIALLEASRP